MGSRHPPRPGPQRCAETTVTEHTLGGREGLSGKTPRQEGKKKSSDERDRQERSCPSLLQQRWTSLLFSPLGNSPSSSPLLGKAVLRPLLPGRPGLRSQQGPAEDLKGASPCLTGGRGWGVGKGWQVAPLYRSSIFKFLEAVQEEMWGRFLRYCAVLNSL